MNSNVWFISDLHFSHVSVLYFHPWRRESIYMSIDELRENKQIAIERHDEWLIELWNNTIAKRDFVYILGDFCLGNKDRAEKILQRLHGRKYLIRGNHDKSCNGLENYFEWVGDIKEAKFNHDQYPFIKEGETFCIEMCHYPLLTWNRRPHGTCMVHGHCHGGIDGINAAENELRVDVGLDGKLSRECGGFISLEELYAHYQSIIKNSGFNTFQDFIDNKMAQDGYRA